MSRQAARTGSGRAGLPGSTGDDAGLEHFYQQIKAVILSRQDPVTGLLPASTAVNAHGSYTDAWVRDNVYSILAVWGLALAYRKVDVDRGRTVELEGCVVKLMRGLLFAMMRQAGKVERFKQTQAPQDALHAKYSTTTGATVVGDAAWGHLQLDATSLFLLILGQMTASGLNIIFTIDEVNFVQNLVYYIGRAYQTPDYGIWERGNKINSGNPELNASSVGMAKAALEAMNGLDLFGVRGSQASVIHVLADEVARARITLESLLPWESCSKEVDAALLSVIGFPAFAVEDVALVERTRARVTERLKGRFGCKRFLRDGHQTVIEDMTRLYYEPWELKQFEHIECEWPLFFTFLWLDCFYRDDREGVREYRSRLHDLLVPRHDSWLLPELYYVPLESIAAEKLRPGSQARLPNENIPLVWAQSLYYLGQMLDDGLLDRGDLDPLARSHRVGVSREMVVQLALLAEDGALQLELEAHGIATQTPRQIEPIQVRDGAELAAAYNQIGRNDKLRLTGRPIRRLRSLTTSKVFRIRGDSIVFLPSFLDSQQFYLTLDEHFFAAQVKSELAYVERHWSQPGRPTVTLLLTHTMWETGREAVLELMESFQGGRCHGVPVRLGRLRQLMATSGKERIDFLHDFEFAETPLRDAVPSERHLSYEPAASVPLAGLEELDLERETSPQLLLCRLAQSANLYAQIEILQNLARQHGPGFDTGWGGPDRSITIADLLDEIYTTAARGDAERRPYWAVVRRAAALLGKVDLGLADAVTDILVRQKEITVGKAYFEDSSITRPLLPDEIMDKIRSFAGEDVRELVLTQEIIIFLGLLIKSEPQVFEGLLTLRVGYLILLLTSELSQELGMRQEEAYERLLHLGPSEIQRRLRRVLIDQDDTAGLLRRQEALPLLGGSLEQVQAALPEARDVPPGGWLRLRQREGALNRVPERFYPRVWKLLAHCHGLIIGDKLERRNRLESSLILAEMTAGEKSFAVWIEHLLNKVEIPEYRQLNIEAMMALAELTERVPDLRIEEFITLDVLIGHAVRLSWLERYPHRVASYDEDKPAAWRWFYEASPGACAGFVVSALQLLAATRTLPVLASSDLGCSPGTGSFGASHPDKDAPATTNATATTMER